MIYRSVFVSLGFLGLASCTFAQQTNAQATYTLQPTPKTVAWGYYDAKTPPVLRVTELVDGNKGVHTMIPKIIFPSTPSK